MGFKENIEQRLHNERPIISKALGDFLLENVHVSVHGKQEELNKAKSHLAEGRSLIIVFNHFAKLDAIAFGKVIEKYISPLEKVAALASYRHLDPERGIFNRIQAGLIEDWHEIFGPRAIPVIQRKDYGDYQDASSINRKAIKEAVRFLKEPGHILAISPEGTRSKADKLLRAEDGLELLLRLGGEKTKILTLAGEHSSIRPINTITNITIGELLGYQDLLEDRKIYLEHYLTQWQEMGLTEKTMPDITIADCAMVRVAENLPVNNQGVYTELVAIRKKLELDK